MARQYMKVVGVGGGRGGTRPHRVPSAPKIARAKTNGRRKV